MKKNKPYYLKYYKEWMETGKLPSNGLCSLFKHDPLFLLIDPDKGGMSNYWGIDGTRDGGEFCLYDCEYIWYAFTPFRQTIVLLMAAQNNEL